MYAFRKVVEKKYNLFWFWRLQDYSECHILGNKLNFHCIKTKANSVLNLIETMDIFLPFNFLLATLTVDR